jgi:mannose-6-phosphate isomerase-like protein (cupin superfamily)
MIWVQRGIVTLTIAGQGYQVGPQMCATFPGGVPHRYENGGDGRADMIMIVVVPPAG